MIAVDVAKYLRELGYSARAHIDGNYRVIAPLVARAAGLGPGQGSRSAAGRHHLAGVGQGRLPVAGLQDSSVQWVRVPDQGSWSM